MGADYTTVVTLSTADVVSRGRDISRRAGQPNRIGSDVVLLVRQDVVVHATCARIEDT